MYQPVSLQRDFQVGFNMKHKLIKLGKEIVMLGTYEDYTADEIIDVLKIADQYYDNDEQSFLEDNEYDALRRYVERLEPNHQYFTRVGSEVRGGKVKLPYEMGSLDQVYEGEIADWVEKHSLQDETIVITNKLDGISAMIIYDIEGKLQIGYSRGNGIEGADITRHIKKIPTIPKDGVIPGLVVRGEIIFPIDKFEQIKQFAKSRSGEPYKNRRNAIAGLMNAETNALHVYPAIDFVAHGIVNSNVDKTTQLDQLLNNMFSVVVIATLCKGRQLNDKVLTEYLNKNREVSEYEIDGLVIDVDSAVKRMQMTPTRDTLNPGYAVKYKVADASNQTVADVIEVQWNESKHGYLKPRVRIKPVELVGVTIQHATGFNAKFIYDNGIGPGAKVNITRSGDVIPFIQSVVKSVAPEMPTCEWEWNETGVDAIAETAGKDRLINQLIDFFSTLEVSHLKEGNIRTMCHENTLTNFSHAVLSMIHYNEQHWFNCLGVNGKKIYDRLHEKLTNIPLYKLMGASPFFGRGVGVRKFKKLQQSLGANKIFSANINEIIAVEGFDKKTAVKILYGMPKFLDFLSKIGEQFISFTDDDTDTGGCMVNQKVVFTGFRDKQLSVLVEAEGGTMQSGVSGKTTILVIAKVDSNSTKAKKARELGVRVLSIDQFKQMLGV